MSYRRQFLASSSAALAAPLATSLLSACGSSSADDSVAASDEAVAISDSELKRQTLGRLAAELDDTAAAESIYPEILDFALSWKPPTAAVASLDRIVAYAFGNRPNEESGNTPVDGGTQVALPDPGPVNEQLADTVFAIWSQRQVKVYAQWEIARFLVSKYNMIDVVSIEPVINDDGSVTYLSTDGVAASIIEQEQNNAAGMGVVGVVGFRDHHKRCVLTSRDRGMDAYAPEGITMPGDYDEQSGQAWTRRRDLYLLHDMTAQIMRLRTLRIDEAYPDG